MQGQEPSHANLTPAQRELEAALRELSPAACGIDRDRLLYAAGTAAGRSRGMYVQLLAGILAITLGCALFWRSEPHVAERAAHGPASGPFDVPPPGSPPEVTPGTAKPAWATLPFPVPGGPFVAVPQGRMTAGSTTYGGGTRTSAYLTMIHGVLQKRLGAFPRARPSDPHGPRAPAERGSRPGDAPPRPMS